MSLKIKTQCWSHKLEFKGTNHHQYQSTQTHWNRCKDALLNKNNKFFTSRDLDEVIHEVTLNIYLDAGHRVCLSWSLKLLIKSDKMPAVEVKHTFNVRSMTISLSFCLLCMYLFLCESLFRQNTALCSVSLINGWIESCVVASLITNWPR